MPDVYVEVGNIKQVPPAFLGAAQAAMRAAIHGAVKKVGSGMTTLRPVDGKGIQVNAWVTKLVQDGINTRCNVIGELFELPTKQRFNPGGNASGEGKVVGKLETVAGACIGAAITDLMNRIGPAIASSQAAQASTGTANSKSPLIFIAPLEVGYPKDPKAAPPVLAAKAKAAIVSMVERKIKSNPKRFTLDSNAFRAGSGMPAYRIGITVDTLAFNAGAQEMVAKIKGFIAEHPSGSMKVPLIESRARMRGGTKPPREDDQVQLVADAAESGAETAIKWILQSHP